MNTNKSLLLKSLTVAGLGLVILIALWMVDGVVEDRQKYRNDAIHSIEESFAKPQTLIGPVLVRPYSLTTETEVVNKGIKSMVQRKQALLATSFPREYKVTGAMQPSQHRRGLYKVEVYELQGTLQGHFDIVDPQTTGKVEWGEPYLQLSVSDVRGIVGTPKATVNGVEESIQHASQRSAGWDPNLHIPLHGTHALTGQLNFNIQFNLGGTESLSIAPIGDTNTIELQSPWKSPLFTGQFLPHDLNLDATGFHAIWQVPSLASRTQTQLSINGGKDIDLMTVNLATLVDPYTLGSRAVKYGILFVVLTFGGFMIFELMKRLPIHPVQYLLVGFGLAIFFLLLVSFSEYMPFGQAYLIASASCIGLLTFYLCSVLRSRLRGLAFGAMLASLYSAIYGLLISEDNALVLGSLLLFFLLALVIVITRNVDWYRGSAAALPDNLSSQPEATL